MIKNKYKSKMWREFSKKQKKIFNKIMKASLKHQEIIVHPDTIIPDYEWDTICHNFACYAAWII